jgi:hypothetical protein
MSRETPVGFPAVTFFESLEPRLLLDGQTPTVDLFNASPARTQGWNRKATQSTCGNAKAR